MQKKTAEKSFNAPSEDQIPEIVFEEVLVNALVHRDYFLPDSVKIYIFDDRIEIISPGCLPNILTPEEAMKGIGRERNPLLLRFAYAIDELPRCPKWADASS